MPHARVAGTGDYAGAASRPYLGLDLYYARRNCAKIALSNDLIATGDCQAVETATDIDKQMGFRCGGSISAIAIERGPV